MTKSRWDKVILDLTSGNVPTPVARVHTGDQTDDGGTDVYGNEDTLCQAQMARIPPPLPKLISGNHDMAYPLATPRGQAAYEAAYAAAPWSVSGPFNIDLTFVRLLGMQCTNATAPGILAQTQLDWLDAALVAAGSQDCWIFFHYPLTSTVLGNTSGVAADLQVFSSTEAGFHAYGPNGTDDSQIRTILTNRANARAWIHGHTHSPIETPGFVTTLSLGGKNIAHICASASVYTARSIQVYDPVRTVYITKPPSGASRIEVRFRDHASGIWCSVGGSRVTTVLM